MLHHVIGDATQPGIFVLTGCRVIVHICNDIGAWGKGFVMAVSSRFPQAKSQYKRAIRKGAGLGDVVFTECDSVFPSDAIVVANMIAQKGIDGSGRKVMYGALRKCLKKVAEFAASRPGVTIHMPLIGCGLGGGRWEEVEPIVKECLGEFEVYVYGRPMCGWGC